MTTPPVRLCCNTRHWGPMCPDRLVMCCICFDRVPIEKLSRDQEGRPQDVCQNCEDKV